MPAEALVFRGPPLQAQPPRAGIKWWVWLGLGIGGAGLAALAYIYAVRRAKKSPAPSGAAKDELKMPSELLFKEPLNLPEETVMPERP